MRFKYTSDAAITTIVDASLVIEVFAAGWCVHITSIGRDSYNLKESIKISNF